MRKILRLNPITTAVITYNDISAIGAMRAIKDNRLNVPNDISVMGFDNILLSSFTIPRLTTMNFPQYKMSEVAFELLQKRLSGKALD